MKYKITFLLIICLFTYKIQAQLDTIQFERIGIKDGLSEVVVQSVLQDNKGFMWFGTQDGLNMYDGKNFKIFRPDFEDPDNTISTTAIFRLYQSADNNLWICSGAGLNMYNKKTEKFHTFVHNENDTNSIRDNLPFRITEDSQNNMWIFTRFGIDKLKKHTDNYDSVSFIHYNYKTETGDSINLNGRINIITDANGDVWLANFNTGLYRIPAHEQPKDIPAFIHYQNTPQNPNLLPQAIVNFIIDKQGTPWIFAQDTITKIDISKKEPVFIHYDVSNLPQIFRAQAFYITQDEIMYLGHFGTGLIVYNLKTKKYNQYLNNPMNPTSISQNSIIQIYEDNAGIIWIGTTKGINKYDKNKNKFKHVAPQPLNPNWLRDEYVFSFETDKQNNLWVGTLNANGIYIYNHENNQFRNIRGNFNNPDSLFGNNIRVIHRDAKDNIWVGTIEGSWSKYNAQEDKFTNYRIRQPLCVLEDKYGNFWLGTSGAGLVYFNTTTNSFERFYNDFGDNENTNLSGNRVRAIYRDSKDNLWIGTEISGLDKMVVKNNDTTFVNYRANTKDSTALSNDGVFDIYEDKDGFLWLATFGGGLNKLDPETEIFKHYTIKNGLPSNNLYGILPDDEGNLWLSTNNGLSKFNPATEEFTNFYMSDGLQSNEFNSGAFFKDKEGNFYFGGVNGYNIFKPEDIKSNPIPPQVVFTDFKVFNKSVMPGENSLLKISIQETKEIRLKYEHKDITFEFAALHYSAPEKNTYAYMIENYNDEWVELGTRNFVTYSKLPPGKYILKVKAANCDGLWCNEPISIILIVKPPFWKTIWFYSIIIIFLVVLIWFFIRLREKKLKREKQILEQKVIIRTKQIQERNEEILQKNEELNQQTEEILTQRDEIEQQHFYVSEQRDKIVKQQKDINDSIQYAQRIQTSVLPSLNEMNNIFPNNFILFMPRDIVSGDFYWFRQISQNNTTYKLIIAADCTGHGVPGGFMSMLGVTLLNEIINKITGELKANIILNELRNKVIETLHQTDEAIENRDGMDIAFCIYNQEDNTLQYAGANNPLYIFRKENLTDNTNETSYKLIEYKPDKMPIGIYIKKISRSFKNNEVKLQKNDTIYIFSDGFYDQFGGKESRKFLKFNFKKLLHSIQNQDFEQQKQSLKQSYNEWIAYTDKRTNNPEHEQTDDILIIGIKFTY